jgi:sterol-4alpha-carboxylate 3-dehydrogenase (decarboxylating)
LLSFTPLHLPMTWKIGKIYAGSLNNSQKRALFHRVNVLGTKKVIECCHAARVPRLVLTSSCSVVYNGEDIENGDENLPYAVKPQDYYTETKILQEKVVLEANGSSGGQSDYQLLTVACRPHGIFGPDDPNVVPTIVKMAKTGKTKFAIGDGSNLVDETYVKNVAYGHYLAGEALHEEKMECSGQAFNITNDEPVQFWTFMSIILTTLGYPAPRFYLPYGFIYTVASILAYIIKFLRATVAPNMPAGTFTPMRVALAGTHHYYSCAKAKKLLGYKPYIPLRQAIDETMATFEHLRNGVSDKYQ